MTPGRTGSSLAPRAAEPLEDVPIGDDEGEVEMHVSATARRSRRRRAQLVLLAAVVVALSPEVWTSGDLVLRSSFTITIAVAAVVAARLRHRAETPAAAYARALKESAALHVRLRQARVAAVHVGEHETRVTFTWRAATTTLLDADGRPRAEVARNALTAAYTISVPVNDSDAVARLSRDDGLGRLSIYGTTDLMAHPHGNLLENGLVVDQYDLDFPSWSGSLLSSSVLAD